MLNNVDYILIITVLLMLQTNILNQPNLSLINFPDTEGSVFPSIQPLRRKNRIRMLI